MSCERFSDAIVDHACGADLDARLAAHLERCAACRQTLDDVRRQLAESETELREALAISASPEFVTRVSERTDSARPAHAWTRAWWVGVAAAASIAFAVAVNVTESGRVPDRASRRPTRESINLAPERRVSSHETTAAAHAEEPAVKTVRSSARTPTVQPRASRAELVVIVAPDQGRAIARLRELLRNGALDDTTLPKEATAPTAVLIAPLSIPELSVPDIQPVPPPPSGGADHRP